MTMHRSAAAAVVSPARAAISTACSRFIQLRSHSCGTCVLPSYASKPRIATSRGKCGGSWFPLVDRNPQTFVDIHKASEADFHAATHALRRTVDRPSTLGVRVLCGRLPH